MKLWKKIRQEHSNELTLALVFIGLFSIFGILSPDRFLTANNIKSMAFQMPEFGFAALGMMVVILTGGINLSIMTQAALSSICGAFVLTLPFSEKQPLAAILLALIVCIAVAVITGMINGVFTAYVGVTAMLVTLGTMTLFTGIGLNFTKGGAVSGFPEGYSIIGNADILGIPVPIIIYIIGIVASYFLLERSSWGVKVYMIGCSNKASRFSAINTKRILMSVYIFSGVMAGLSGIIMSSRYNSAKVDYGSSYLMQSIAAVVLGGTRISGGHGTVSGTVIAVLIIQVMSTGMNILGVNSYIVNIIIGMILLSVLAVEFFTHNNKRLLATKSKATVK